MSARQAAGAAGGGWRCRPVPAPRGWREGGGVACVPRPPRRLGWPAAPRASRVPAAEPLPLGCRRAAGEVGAFAPLCLPSLAARRRELPAGGRQAFSPAARSSAARFEQNRLSEGDPCPVSARASAPCSAAGRLPGRARRPGRAAFGLAGRGAGGQPYPQLPAAAGSPPLVANKPSSAL